jgi:TRAP-type C4-dicarboxylate transport system permease small subunit
MGGDIINMVESALFLGLIMLACVTILVIGMTGLLILTGWDLAKELWNKVKKDERSK